jgi:hypothetical protein
MTECKYADATGKIPDRSSKTTARYRQRGSKFVARTRRDLNDPEASLAKIVDVFLTSDDKYKPSSQRAIRAWLLQIAHDAIAANPANSELKELPHKLHAGCGAALVCELQGKLESRANNIEHVVEAFLSADRQYSARSQDAMIETLRMMIATSAANRDLSGADVERLLATIDNNRPAPKGRRRIKQTSAKKRKEIPLPELQAVTKYLAGTKDKLNDAAAKFLKLNVFLGLRPNEWRSAYLEGSSLHWTAEKTSNSRGNTKRPALHLQSAGFWLVTLRGFLAFLKPYRDDEREWERLFDRLRSRIAYACKKLGIARIAMYAARDQFIATELAIGTDPVELAAKVNHKSVRTQRRHYASKRSGYKMSHSLTAVDRCLVVTVIAAEPFSIEKLKGAQPQFQH